jgi:hypothetical protein
VAPVLGDDPSAMETKARFALDAPKGMVDSLIELFVERD